MQKIRKICTINSNYPILKVNPLVLPLYEVQTRAIKSLFDSELDVFPFNSAICSLAYPLTHISDKVTAQPDRGGASGRADAVCKPPVGHYLHHHQHTIKNGRSINHMKVFIPQMLHIRFVKNIYSLAGACWYKSKRLFRPPNQIVLSQVESNEIFIQ